MADADNIRKILEEISGLADSTSKAVLATYNPEEDHAVNKGNMTKHNVEYLERCASFLNIKLINEQGRKLFTTKANLADRVILIIESLFPTTCMDCNTNYRIKLNDPEPPIRCLFCMQGSHNCENRVNSLKSINELNKQCLAGIAWLCKGCYTKNNATGLNQFSGTSQVPSNTPSDNLNVQQSVCEDYRRGKCVHGISGKKVVGGEVCKFSHPKKCLKWCKYGKNHRYGCNKGDECNKFHPLLCKFALKKVYCRSRNCTYAHPKGTSYFQSQELNNNANFFNGHAFSSQQNRDRSHPSNNSLNENNFQRNMFAKRHPYQSERILTPDYERGFKFAQEDFPKLATSLNKRKINSPSVPVERDEAFFFISSGNDYGDGKKISNQADALQNTMLSLAPQAHCNQPIQGKQIQHQYWDQNPQLSQFRRNQSHT